MSKIAMHTIWIGQSSRTNCMFHILEEVGAELKMSISRPAYVNGRMKKTSSSEPKLLHCTYLAILSHDH